MLCWWRGVHCPARTKEVPAAAHHVRLWPLVPVGDEEALENERDVGGVALYSRKLHYCTEWARSQVLLFI